MAGKGTAPLETLDIIAGRPNVIDITLKKIKKIRKKKLAQY